MPQFDLDNYVSVAERVQKFRAEYQGWSLLTELLVDDGQRIVMRAEIIDDNGIPRARGHAEEVRDSGPVNRTSAVENAETSAWGRALANLGLHVSRSLASRDEMRQAQERAERQKEPTRSQKLKTRIDALPTYAKTSLGEWCDKHNMTRVTAQMTEAELAATEEWVDNAEDDGLAPVSPVEPSEPDHQPDRYAAASSFVNGLDKTALVKTLADYKLDVPRTTDAQKRALVEAMMADDTWSTEAMPQESLAI